MPLPAEEPQIHESAQGPRTTPATSRPAPTPRPTPGPRPSAHPRPGRPGPGRALAPAAQREPRAAKPVPAPRAPQAPATPQLQLIPAAPAGALDAAEEAVDLLLDSGRAPGEILVITTGDPHPWAVHELSFGEAAYWSQHQAAEDVFHVQADSAARTSARPVVVVAVNGGEDRQLSQSLPLAMTKAGALLIVCGDPERIRTALGAGV